MKAGKQRHWLVVVLRRRVPAMVMLDLYMGGDGPFWCREVVYYVELLLGDFRCIAAGFFFFDNLKHSLFIANHCYII
jgi:hypothetical protein